MTEVSSQTVRVGLVQRAVGAAREETLRSTEAGVRLAADQGAQLVCLQELFCDPYFCQTADPNKFVWAEPLDGPVVKRMSVLAQECNITLLVPFFEKRAPGLFHNSAALVGPSGERLGLYRKMHIPDDPQFMEKYYFTPGDLGFMAIDSPVGKVGTLICWDQWYPEAARLTALAGARVLLYPTAIGWMHSEKATDGAAQLDAWKTMHRAHAIANGVFVIAVNRVGIEGGRENGLEFWGHSMVIDPFGRVLCEAGEEEQVLVCDLEMSLLDETRKWWPFFRDRRVDAYGGLTSRWLEP